MENSFEDLTHVNQERAKYLTPVPQKQIRNGPFQCTAALSQEVGQ